jgi:signal transduction histidine kinase
MLPGALLTGVLVWRVLTSDRQALERRLLESARVDASALDRQFEGTISTLRGLATSAALDRQDIRAFYEEASRIQATQKHWATVVLLSVDGHQLVSTRLPWGAPLAEAAEPESVEQLIRSRQPVVGPVRTAKPGGPSYVFAVRVPVLRGDQLKYVLSAVMNVEALAEVIPKPRPESEEWSRNILDPSGTIAVRTRGSENYVGTPATSSFRARIARQPETISREQTRDGADVYAATARSSFAWTTVVVVPPAVLESPARASLTALLFGGLLLMFCGLGAVLVVSRRLADDLAAATDAAAVVAEGRPMRDTTAHVAETARLQRSLAAAASLLADRARERDDEVRRADAARAEAEDANRTKDQFLAVLGHELRNPLAPAVTALELMKARDPHALVRERQVLERQVAHMTRLVNDLLDVSRLTRGKVQLHRRLFELREAVDRALDMARPLIVQHQHALDVSVPATGLPLDADIDRIVQILSNLLTNAAKYTAPGGRIALIATVSAEQIMIACEDNGPGVPAALLSKLFQPFAQGPRTIERSEGGLGLGLALARMFVELHGGSIWVELRGAEDGSRFVVTLPRAFPASEAAPLPTPAVALGRRVLVVDDNADAREMLAEALQQAGHLVAVAGTGPDAIDVARTFNPEVGVLDIGLPGMNGYELAIELRRMVPRIRLVAVTGYGQGSDFAAAADAGFDAHFAKPITLAVLIEEISAAAAFDEAAG